MEPIETNTIEKRTDEETGIKTVNQFEVRIDPPRRAFSLPIHLPDLAPPTSDRGGGLFAYFDNGPPSLASSSLLMMPRVLAADRQASRQGGLWQGKAMQGHAGRKAVRAEDYGQERVEEEEAGDEQHAAERPEGDCHHEEAGPQECGSDVRGGTQRLSVACAVDISCVGPLAPCPSLHADLLSFSFTMELTSTAPALYLTILPPPPPASHNLQVLDCPTNPKLYIRIEYVDGGQSMPSENGVPPLEHAKAKT